MTTEEDELQSKHVQGGYSITIETEFRCSVESCLLVDRHIRESP